MSTADQPVSTITWVHRDRLTANGYNPNHVAPPEKKLLALSIIEDGWTQPIVTRPAGDDTWEIVDGFHRWEVSSWPEVADLTDSHVPIVELDPDPAGQRMSTIRHNRARGTHGVKPMADIVAELFAMGLDRDEVGRQLGMEREEVTRLAQRGDMLTRGRSGDGFGKAWRPAPAG